MFAWPLLLSMINQMWYALPLLAVVSLVYAATRHEEPAPIVAHATRLATSIAIFMAIVFAILYFISFYWI